MWLDSLFRLRSSRACATLRELVPAIPLRRASATGVRPFARYTLSLTYKRDRLAPNSRDVVHL